MTLYQPITKKTKYYNSGKNINAPVVGAVCNNNGVISGFSSSNYVLLRDIELGNNFEIGFKFTYVAQTSKDWQNLLRKDVRLSIAVSEVQHVIQSNVGDGSSWIGTNTYGTTTLVSGNTYWVKLCASNGSRQLFLSSDGVNYNLEVTDICPVLPKLTYYIGTDDVSSNTNVTGSIDFNESYVKINDELVWHGTNWVDDSITRPNGLVYGNVICNDNVISGFSASNKFRLPDQFNPGSGNTWEWRMKLRTPGTIPSGNIQFVGGGTNDGSGFEAGVYDGKWTWWLGTTLGTYDIASRQQSTYSVIPNTDYYLKMYFTGTQYIFDYSLDGITYTNAMSTTSSAIIAGDYKGLGADFVMNGAFWTGTIDLKECSAYINDELWWDGTAELPAPTAESHDYEMITETESPLISKRLSYFKKTNKVDGQIIGSVIVNKDGGAYNFAQNNYIKVHKQFNPHHKSWEILTHFNTGSAYNDNKVLFDFGDGATTRAITAYIRASAATDGYAKKMVIGLKSGSGASGPWIRTETGCSHVLEFNTDYWYRLSFDGVNLYKGEVSTDGTTWEDDFTVTNETPIYPSNTILFGQWAGYAANTYFAGTIYFKDCHVKIDDEYWWTGTVSSDAPTIYSINGSAVADLKISDDRIYNFSNLNYFTLPQMYNHTQPWEYNTAFKFTSLDTAGMRIIGKDTSDIRAGMVIGTSASNPANLSIWLTSAGASWDISNGTPITTYYLCKEVKYYLRVKFTGTQYLMDISTDKVNYTNLFTLNSTTPIYQTVPFDLGTYGNCYTRGNIYLKDTYLKVNDVIVWNGAIEEHPSSSNYDYTKIVTKEYLPITKRTKYYKFIGIPNGSASGLLCTQDAILSGFTTTRYFTIQNNTLDFDAPFEIVEKVHYVESTSSQSFWFCKQYYAGGGYINGSNKHLQIYMSTNGTSWDLAAEVYGTYTFINNTDYWIKLTYNGKGQPYTWAISTDGENYITDITINNGTPLKPTNFWFGLSDVFSAPWLGTIDLKGCYIKQHGKYIWRGAKSVCKDTLVPNGVNVGNLFVDNKKLRCYETYSGVMVPTEFNPGSSPWEIVFKYRTDNKTSYDTRPYSSTVDFRGIHMVSRQTGLYNVISTNGTSWTITTGNFIPVPNTLYWIKQTFTGTSYDFYYSTDGENYTLVSSTASTAPMVSSYFFLNNIGWDLSTNFAANGITYLDGTYININGERWWDAGVLVQPSASNYDYVEIG